MKLNALILTIAMLPAVAAGAQEGLSVNGLFNARHRNRDKRVGATRVQSVGIP